MGNTYSEQLEQYKDCVETCDCKFMHEGLTNKTIDFIKHLPIDYGICTNRPLSDIPDLDYLKGNKFYICEGGVVSYE